jgi:hypothetical protein
MDEEEEPNLRADSACAARERTGQL